MVTDSLKSVICGEYGCLNSLDRPENEKNLQKECMEISYYQSDIDRLLLKGAKIISASPSTKVVKYNNTSWGTDVGECIGTEYIIEGYQEDFDKL